jgi:hypothetical protein
MPLRGCAPAGADLAAENARLRRENGRPRMEWEILKNAAHFLGSVEMKLRLIEDQCDTFKVRAMCDALGIAPAGFTPGAAAPSAIGRRSTVPCWPRSGGSTRTSRAIVSGFGLRQARRLGNERLVDAASGTGSR